MHFFVLHKALLNCVTCPENCCIYIAVTGRNSRVKLMRPRRKLLVLRAKRINGLARGPGRRTFPQARSAVEGNRGRSKVYSMTERARRSTLSWQRSPTNKIHPLRPCARGVCATRHGRNSCRAEETRSHAVKDTNCCEFRFRPPRIGSILSLV